MLRLAAPASDTYLDVPRVAGDELLVDRLNARIRRIRAGARDRLQPAQEHDVTVTRTAEVEVGWNRDAARDAELRLVPTCPPC